MREQAIKNPGEGMKLSDGCTWGQCVKDVAVEKEFSPDLTEDRSEGKS